MAEYKNLGMINKPNNTFYRSGKVVHEVNAVVTNDVYTDGAVKAIGDVFFLTDGISIDSRVHRVMSYIGDLTGANDNDLVLLKEIKDINGNVVYEEILDLVTGLVLTTASTAIKDLMKTSTLDRTKSIRELLIAADEELPSRVFLGLKAVVIPGATVNLNMDIKIEEATSY